MQFGMCNKDIYEALSLLMVHIWSIKKDTSKKATVYYTVCLRMPLVNIKYLFILTYCLMLFLLPISLHSLTLTLHHVNYLYKSYFAYNFFHPIITVNVF